jgi:hypothetical protein
MAAKTRQLFHRGGRTATGEFRPPKRLAHWRPGFAWHRRVAQPPKGPPVQIAGLGCPTLSPSPAIGWEPCSNRDRPLPSRNCASNLMRLPRRLSMAYATSLPGREQRAGEFWGPRLFPIPCGLTRYNGGGSRSGRATSRCTGRLPNKHRTGSCSISSGRDSRLAPPASRDAQTWATNPARTAEAPARRSYFCRPYRTHAAMGCLPRIPAAANAASIRGYFRPPLRGWALAANAIQNTANAQRPGIEQFPLLRSGRLR